MALILTHHGKTPELIKPSYLAPTTQIIGEVSAGEGCSFWFQSIIRGDVNFIRIGERTNVQDLSMLHVSYKRAPLIIGSDVTIGHSCILHGCTLEDRILVGMGTTIMDHAQIGSDVLIGAGSLITENMKIPPGVLVLGRPAKILRELSLEEIAYLKRSAEHYLKVAASYADPESQLLHPAPLDKFK